MKIGTYYTYITTYVENYIVGRSRNHCCHLNAKLRSLSSVVGEDVAVNNIEEFTVAMELQQWVPFAPLPSYKIFRTAVDNRKY